VLLGPRQCGKITIARKIADIEQAEYFDNEHSGSSTLQNMSDSRNCFKQENSEIHLTVTSVSPSISNYPTSFGLGPEKVNSSPDFAFSCALTGPDSSPATLIHGPLAHTPDPKMVNGPKMCYCAVCSSTVNNLDIRL
jgi:hypothetical protein